MISRDLFTIVESSFALIISLVVAIISVIKFFRYDRLISRQELRMNEFLLAEAREKADNQRKADICLCFTDLGKFKVYNKGLASARNIKVSFSSDMSYFIGLKNELIVEKLDSLQNKDYSITLITGHPDVIQAQISWSDDFDANNVKEISVYIQ